MADINLSELYSQYQQEDEITVLEEGQYELEVVRVSIRNDNAVMPVYRVVSGPQAGKTVMAGQFTLTEKARSIFFRQMAGFGLDEQFFRTARGLEDVKQAIVGKVVNAHIKQKDWQGSPRNEIPIGGISLLRDAAPAGSGAIPSGGVAAPPAPAPAAPPAQPPQPPAENATPTPPQPAAPVPPGGPVF